MRVCYGQCFDRELPHEPYYPFLDALIALDRRTRVRSPRPRTARAVVAGGFPQWNGRLAPTVHAVRMFDELGAALAAFSHDLPLILVLEDLQWADVDTINALARLAESQIPSKLLIVGTCCDGEWTAGHGRSIACGPLPRTRTRSADARARQSDARARRRAIRRAIRSRLPLGAGAGRPPRQPPAIRS